MVDIFHRAPRFRWIRLSFRIERERSPSDPARDEEVEILVKQLYTRSLMQRTFLAALVRRLALDVPTLDLDMFQDHLYVLAEHLPYKPESGQGSIEAAGREELEALIQMVEEVIEANWGKIAPVSRRSRLDDLERLQSKENCSARKRRTAYACESRLRYCLG